MTKAEEILERLLAPQGGKLDYFRDGLVGGMTTDWDWFVCPFCYANAGSSSELPLALDDHASDCIVHEIYLCVQDAECRDERGA